MSDEEFIGPPQEVPIGPPQDRPWDNFSDEQKAHYEYALQLAEGIKNYREAGTMAKDGSRYADHSAALHRRGGMTTEEATNLARYRMWKQGMQDIPVGPRAPAMSDDEIGARRDAFVAGSPELRQQMMREDKSAIDRGHEGYFDSLVQPQQPAQDPRVAVVNGVPVVTAYADPQAIARAQGGM